MPSIAGWQPEDWDSDAKSIIRGYLISKNQNDGKAQFRLEDFDHIYDQSQLGEPKVDKGIKPIASEFIPAEGADFVRLVLSTMNIINQEELPDRWKTDESSPVSLPDDIVDTPDADILHADDNYILMHLKNESAAKSFGSNPAWCITYGWWDKYKDNFLFICDKDGYRYGIHLAGNQCVDQNDLAVPFGYVCQKFNGLEGRIARFYRQQLKKALANNDLKSMNDIIAPSGFITEQPYKSIILTSLDPDDIKDATLTVSKRTHPQWLHMLFYIYTREETTRRYFIENELIRLPFELHRRGLVENSITINAAILDAARFSGGALNNIIQEEINELATHGHKHQDFIKTMVEFMPSLEMPQFPKPKGSNFRLTI